MQTVLRFDFNASSNEFTRTPQGFLRVKARLSKSGIFSYDNIREYRSEQEIFKEDSLASIKGAPVTNRHPLEQGGDQFLSPANAKQHIIGITEGVERDGPYLKGSLIIFHEDAIKAIERGECKEISLGYQCLVEPTPGVLNGEHYDAIQKNIIVNHVAIGPEGWGRAGPDCAIKTDSKSPKEQAMAETMPKESQKEAFKSDNPSTPPLGQQEELQALQGRLDALNEELHLERQKSAVLEDPKFIEAKIESRRRFDAIKKLYPDLDLSNKDQSYIEGAYEIASKQELLSHRNDSLNNTRTAIDHSFVPIKAYEEWLSSATNRWKKPLTGHL